MNSMLFANCLPSNYFICYQLQLYMQLIHHYFTCQCFTHIQYNSIFKVPQFGKYSIVRTLCGYQLPTKISYTKIYYNDYFITTIILYNICSIIPVAQIVEGACMPIVFHVARISFLFRQENLSAIKGKAGSSHDTSQFTLWCYMPQYLMF